MQTKYLCVLIHIWRRETGLSPQVKYFTDYSKAVLFVDLLCCFSVRICLYVPCGHLQRKG